MARTEVMGLPEDVTIRILPDGDGARIDIRSASRYFDSDLGSNAARIARLIEDINEAAEHVNSKPVPKPPVPPSKAQAKNVKK